MICDRSTITAVVERLKAYPKAHATARRLLGEVGVGDVDPRGDGSDLAELFPALEGRVIKRDAVDPATCRHMDADMIAVMLEPGGALSASLPGYEPREAQASMLRAVCDAFNTGRHLMVEAGTGIGKSLAYLLPALSWAELNGTPVVVSTHTRNLQTQLIEKDVPLLEAVLGRKLRIKAIKGRANYICLKRLLMAVDDAPELLGPEERELLVEIMDWALRASDGDIDGLLDELPRAGMIARRLTSTSEECPGAACRRYRHCFLQRARAASLHADVVVANHALVFAEMGMDRVALPAYQQIVFDEAHNLEDAATRHFAVELSASRLGWMLRRLWSGPRRRARGVLAVIDRLARKGVLGGDAEGREGLTRRIREVRLLADAVRDDGEAFFVSVSATVAPREREPVRYKAADTGTPAWLQAKENARRLCASVDLLAQSLDALAKALEEKAGDELPLWRDHTLDVLASARNLRSFIEECAFVLAAADEDHVYWVQTRNGTSENTECCAAPLNIGERLARELYDTRRSVVLCSATLSVNGSFTFMSARLGMDRIGADRLVTCRFDSPFEYERQVRVMAPMFLPEPGSTGDYEDSLSAFLHDLLCRAQGRTLALFTSYGMLQACAALLARPLADADIRLLAQGEGGSRDAMMREFRIGNRCALFGTHSFWEGVDVVGDALSCVLLARLPFPALGDPLVEARCERIKAEGGDSFRGYMLPLAVIRMRQGFGRLIRHRTDRGVVIVADRRMLEKSYGLWFRRAIPCAITRYNDSDSLLSDLADFL